MNVFSDLLAKLRILREHVTMEGRVLEALRRVDGKLLLLLDNKLDIRSIPPAKGCLRLRQEVALLILRIVDVIATSNRIPYWLMYGTLLGAVRHGGFVPWDDDLDIAMLEDDYEKLHDTLLSELPEGLEVQRWSTIDCPRMGIMRVVDQKTGCYIDIYPHLQVSGARFSSGGTTRWERDYQAFMNKRNKSGAYRPLTEHDRKEIRLWINAHRVGDGDRMGISASPEYTTAIPLYRKTYFADDVFPLTQISFEGFVFPAPSHPRAILERIYDTFEKFPSDAGSGHGGNSSVVEDYCTLRISIDSLHSSLKDLLNGRVASQKSSEDQHH